MFRLFMQNQLYKIRSSTFLAEIGGTKNVQTTKVMVTINDTFVSETVLFL